MTRSRAVVEATFYKNLPEVQEARQRFCNGLREIRSKSRPMAKLYQKMTRKALAEVQSQVVDELMREYPLKGSE